MGIEHPSKTKINTPKAALPESRFLILFYIVLEDWLWKKRSWRWVLRKSHKQPACITEKIEMKSIAVLPASDANAETLKLS